MRENRFVPFAESNPARSPMQRVSPVTWSSKDAPALLFMLFRTLKLLHRCITCVTLFAKNNRPLPFLKKFISLSSSGCGLFHFTYSSRIPSRSSSQVFITNSRPVRHRRRCMSPRSSFIALTWGETTCSIYLLYAVTASRR